MLFRVIVLGACAWIATCQTQFSLQEALTLFNSGKYQDALRLASSYMEQHPESAAALKLQGMAQFMLGKPDEALKALQKAVQLAPRDPDSYYYLGRLYFSRDNAVDALSSFQMARELDPASVRVINNLGQAYEALARFTDAEKAYLAALAAERQQAKQSEWPSYNLGLLYLKQGRLDDAIPYLRQAVEHNPKFALGKMKLATALARHGAPDEAIELLRQSLELEPENAEAHYHLGQLLTRLGKTQDAERHFALFNQLQKH